MVCAADEEPDALRTTSGVSMAASNALGDACGGGSSPVSAVVPRVFGRPCHGSRPTARMLGGRCSEQANTSLHSRITDLTLFLGRVRVRGTSSGLRRKAASATAHAEHDEDRLAVGGRGRSPACCVALLRVLSRSARGGVSHGRESLCTYIAW
ncbi:hypothetical protein K466DRAFT_323546 [Polyporus arcularius HHB13444]|uniref:Uncharacterized protein n=1 Tax=Polyporus arcularius HHB13444 TaxID=1314778 RepID=A0A5C3NYF8_9APHY|nr:hypothetical protein K466DRAFT_323546 [Polyporus arcularius HHB13444]